MNILISITAILMGIIFLFLVVALFIKKEYAIEREITIDRNNQDVFDYIRLSKNMNYYNKWWMMDMAAQKNYTGIDGTVGFIAAWDSTNKQAGKGEQEIKKIIENKQIAFEIRFEKPFKGIANSIMNTASLNHQTNVTWVFTGTNQYPMNLMFALLKLDIMLGKDLYTSLEKLKHVIEARS